MPPNPMSVERSVTLADAPDALAEGLEGLADAAVVGVDVERADWDRYWRSAALIQRIAAMRGDASAIAGELDDGPDRAAGARSAIAALYVMAAASRHLRLALARLPEPSAAIGEARRLGVDGGRRIRQRHDERVERPGLGQCGCVVVREADERNPEAVLEREHVRR